MKRWFFFAALVCTAIVGGYFGVNLVQNPDAGPVSLERLSWCAESMKEERRTCWEREVTRLLSEYPGGSIMSALASSAETLRSECHAIGHVVGTRMYEENHSVEESLSECNSGCRNACAHGVVAAAIVAELGEIFPDEDLVHADPDTISLIGKRYCERPTLCHGVGHVILAAEGDVMSSLDTCDGLTTDSDAREKCYEGIFMEHAAGGMSFAGLRNSIDDRVNQGVSPCAAIPERYMHACYRYEWFYVTRKYPNVSESGRLELASRLCDALSRPAQDYCREGIAVFAVDVLEGQMNEMSTYCARYPDGQRAFCDRGMVRRLVDNHSFDDAYDYCSRVSEVRECSDEVTVFMRKKDLNNEEIARLCADSPAYPHCILTR